MWGNISMNSSFVNQLEMPAPGANVHLGPVAEQRSAFSAGVVLVSTPGAADVVGCVAAGIVGEAEAALVEAAELTEESVGSGAPPAHWQRFSTLHGHHVWPEAQALHCSGVAACEFPGIATHSLQQSSLQLMHSAEAEADVPAAVGAGAAVVVVLGFGSGAGSRVDEEDAGVLCTGVEGSAVVGAGVVGASVEDVGAVVGAGVDPELAALH
jgi:hypothetical protein